jgi:magnesium chelatase family protein
MSLASAWAVALHGVDGVLVEIEAHIGPGLPGLQMVGLPDTALSEARDRVRAAVLNSGQRWPPRRMTLALSPATLPKGGAAMTSRWRAHCWLPMAGFRPVGCVGWC